MHQVSNKSCQKQIVIVGYQEQSLSLANWQICVAVWNNARESLRFMVISDSQIRGVELFSETWTKGLKRKAEEILDMLMEAFIHLYIGILSFAFLCEPDMVQTPLFKWLL